MLHDDMLSILILIMKPSLLSTLFLNNGMSKLLNIELLISFCCRCSYSQKQSMHFKEWRLMRLNLLMRGFKIILIGLWYLFSFPFCYDYALYFSCSFYAWLLTTFHVMFGRMIQAVDMVLRHKKFLVKLGEGSTHKTNAFHHCYFQIPTLYRTY